MLIASDLPLQGDDADITRGLADAIRWVLKDHGFRAGRHVVGYQSCDESTAQTGDYEKRRCAANANAFARAEQVVAVIGPFSSFCAQLQIPILNRAPGGPLALVSPSNTARASRVAADRDPRLAAGELIAYYPTGTRNYARVIGRADVEGVALALLAQRLRLGASTCSTRRDEHAGPAAAIRSAARPRGSASGSPGRRTSASTRTSTPPSPTGSPAPGRRGRDRRRRRRAAARWSRRCVRAWVRASRSWSATGSTSARPDRQRRTRGPRRLPGDDGALPDGALRRPAAARFAARFGPRRTGATNAAAAAEVVLQAIARSDGTRASVLRSLRSLHVTDGILGTFTFARRRHLSRAGDRPARHRLHAEGRTPGSLRPRGRGVERVIEVPASLSG